MQAALKILFPSENYKCKIFLYPYHFLHRSKVHCLFSCLYTYIKISRKWKQVKKNFTLESHDYKSGIIRTK